MKNMKKRGTFAAVLAAALATTFLICGCSLFKPSLLSLANATVKNVGKAESAEVNMKIGTEFELKQENLSIGTDLLLDIDTDMEVTKDPRIMKGVSDIEIGILGQKQPVKMEFYVDYADDGTATTYIRMEDGRWTRKVLKPESDKAESDSSNDPLKMGAGLLKMMVENPVDAVLHEETTSVNGKEAYRITLTVPGDMAKKILESPAAGGEEQPVDFDEVDWDSISLPAEIDIYKDSKLPARIYIDLQTAGVQLTSLLLNRASGETGGLLLNSFSLDVEKCTLELIFDRYGEIEPIQIPQEALDAPDESEDPGFSLFDFISR